MEHKRKGRLIFLCLLICLLAACQTGGQQIMPESSTSAAPTTPPEIATAMPSAGAATTAASSIPQVTATAVLPQTSEVDADDEEGNVINHLILEIDDLYKQYYQTGHFEIVITDVRKGKESTEYEMIAKFTTLLLAEKAEDLPYIRAQIEEHLKHPGASMNNLPRSITAWINEVNGLYIGVEHGTSIQCLVIIPQDASKTVLERIASASYFEIGYNDIVSPLESLRP